MSVLSTQGVGAAAWARAAVAGALSASANKTALVEIIVMVSSSSNPFEKSKWRPHHGCSPNPLEQTTNDIRTSTRRYHLWHHAFVATLRFPASAFATIFRFQSRTRIRKPHRAHRDDSDEPRHENLPGRRTVAAGAGSNGACR